MLGMMQFKSDLELLPSIARGGGKLDFGDGSGLSSSSSNSSNSISSSSSNSCYQRSGGEILGGAFNLITEGVHLLTSALDMSASHIVHVERRISSLNSRDPRSPPLISPSFSSFLSSEGASERLEQRPAPAAAGDKSNSSRHSFQNCSIIIPKLSKLLMYDASSLSSSAAAPVCTFSKLLNRMVLSVSSWESFVVTLDKLGDVQVFDSNCNNEGAKSLFTFHSPPSGHFESVSIIGDFNRIASARGSKPRPPPVPVLSSSSTSSLPSSRASSRDSNRSRPSSKSSSRSDDALSLYIIASSRSGIFIWQLDLQYSTLTYEDVSVTASVIENSFIGNESDILHIHPFKAAVDDAADGFDYDECSSCGSLALGLYLNVISFKNALLSVSKLDLCDGEMLLSVELINLSSIGAKEPLSSKSIVACSSDVVAVYFKNITDVAGVDSSKVDINTHTNTHFAGGAGHLSETPRAKESFYVWRLEKIMTGSTGATSRSDVFTTSSRKVPVGRHLHRAPITCVRIFSHRDNAYQSMSVRANNSYCSSSFANLVVTGSSDHSIIISSIDSASSQEALLLLPPQLSLYTLAMFYHKAAVRCLIIQYSNLLPPTTKRGSLGYSDSVLLDSNYNLSLISCSDSNELKAFNITRLIRNLIWNRRKSFALAISSCLKQAAKKTKHFDGVVSGGDDDGDGSVAVVVNTCSGGGAVGGGGNAFMPRHKIFGVVDICSHIASFL